MELVSLKNSQSKKFENLSVKLHDLLITLGIPYYHPPENIVEAFLRLNAKEQNTVLFKMDFFINILQEAIKNSWSFEQDQKLTWYAISKLGLRPPNSMFNDIAPHDCIEIYDSAGIQLFRSFNFCNYCSYSLEELLIYSWSELYTRNEKALQEMHAAAGKALTATREPFEPHITPHVGIELNSRRKREVAVKFTLVSPLFGADGSTQAFLASSRLEILKEENISSCEYH